MVPIVYGTDDEVYLKLGVNPESIAGHGVISFWLYETNSPDIGDTLTFDITSLGIADGIADHSERSSIRCYPNPASDLLWLDSEILDNDATKLSIYDTKGTEVYCGSIRTGTQNGVDIRYLPSGSYFVVLTQENVSSFTRFIKE
jgi:hypothetical protein